MDIIDALSVDAERNDNLKKAKLENGFYNIVDGGKVSTSIDRALLNKAISDARNAFQDGVLFRSGAGKHYWLVCSTK